MADRGELIVDLVDAMRWNGVEERDVRVEVITVSGKVLRSEVGQEGLGGAVE